MDCPIRRWRIHPPPPTEAQRPPLPSPPPCAGPLPPAPRLPARFRLPATPPLENSCTLRSLCRSRPYALRHIGDQTTDSHQLLDEGGKGFRLIGFPLGMIDDAARVHIDLNRIPGLDALRRRGGLDDG